MMNMSRVKGMNDKAESIFNLICIKMKFTKMSK